MSILNPPPCCCQVCHRRRRIESKLEIAHAVRRGERPFVSDVDGHRIMRHMTASLAALVAELGAVLDALDALPHGRLPRPRKRRRSSTGAFMRRPGGGDGGGFMRKGDGFDRMINRAKRATALDPRLPS